MKHKLMIWFYHHGLYKVPFLYCIILGVFNGLVIFNAPLMGGILFLLITIYAIISHKAIDYYYKNDRKDAK